MNRTELRLWFDEARTEIRRWPRRALKIWAACFAATLVLWLLAVSAKSATIDTVSAQALTRTPEPSLAAPVAANSTEPESIAAEPTELVILAQQEPPGDEALKRIGDTALDLHSRLQTSPEPAALHAFKAGRVAGLVVAIRQDELTDGDQSFWQPISESIADLERAVRLGEIRDSPTMGLIAELRRRYAELRVGLGATVIEPSGEPSEIAVEPNEPVPDVESGPQVGLNSEFGGAAKTTPIPLILRMLPWLAALLPLACLLFGFQSLRRQVRESHKKNPRAGYTQVASEQHASQMSAQSVQPNRHAAERRTQAAILQLLDEMEPLAEGDLTHVASVTEDLTGALADAFNQAVYALRRLVKQINQSSDQVRSAVSQSRERTLKMAQQGAEQAREVTRTHEHLARMQGDVQTLSVSTQSVADHAQDVSQRSQHAAKAVTKNSDALTLMREQADLTERSIQRLVKSTKGIEARLADIQVAAKSTELLALNSTIQAASKGAMVESSGFGFSAHSANENSAQSFSELATSVSSLAALLSSATRDVNRLSDVIRDEANDSLKAVHSTVVQVDNTEELGKQTQAQLNEIVTSSEKLEASVLEIAQRTAEQAKGVVDVTSAISTINGFTHESASALTQSVEDLQQLENLSNSLDATVHGFRLPEDTVK